MATCARAAWRASGLGSKTAEGELGEVPPEAAPPAGEDAGAGNGGGAAEAEPGGASRSAWYVKVKS